MRLRGVVVAVVLGLAGAVWAPSSASAAPVSPEVRELQSQLARAVAQRVPGARVAAPDFSVEPLVGIPGLVDLVAGRTAVMLDPSFWTQVVWNLVASQTIVLPSPVDLLKVEQVLPTSVVENGTRVSPLPRRRQDLGDLKYEFAGRTKTLREYVISTETDGVAFVHDGAIVTDLYANGWSPETRHQPWSVTKSFVSALIGIALDEGRIRSVEEPIDAYVPATKGTVWEGVTIRNLLEMESGVHWDEGTPVLVVNTQVQQWIDLALDLVTGGQLGKSRNQFLLNLPRVAEQGTQFSYNSGNTQMLAWLLETVYNQPFNEVISEKLWVPAGMAGDARVMTDRIGDAIASQGLYSRIFDLARFGEIFRRGGVTSDGVRVVPEKWVRESTTMTEISKGSYAFQWWAGPTPHSYEASGFQGQKISVSPDHCLTGVRLSHTLGLNLSGGSVGIEAGGDEWSAVYRAVADRLGACDAAASAGASARKARLRIGKTTRFSRRGALRRRALRLVVASDRAGRSLTVRAVARRGGRNVTVADRRLTLRSTKARSVSVPLTRAGRRLLAARRAVRVVVTVKSGASTVRRTITLR